MRISEASVKAGVQNFKAHVRLRWCEGLVQDGVLHQSLLASLGPQDVVDVVV